MTRSKLQCTLVSEGMSHFDSCAQQGLMRLFSQKSVQTLSQGQGSEPNLAVSL